MINKDRDQIVPGNYSMEVVFLDIEKYSLNKTIYQESIISDFTNDIKIKLKNYCDQESIDIKKVILIPTGDGMALVFINKQKPGLSLQFARLFLNIRRNYRIRVGVNEGMGIVYNDINGNPNVAGETINLAQRIMSIGDGQQILLSESIYKNVTEFEVVKSSRFRSYSDVEIKHGKLINIYQYLPASSENSHIDGAEPSKIIEPQKLFTKNLRQSLGEINNSFDTPQLSQRWMKGTDMAMWIKRAISKASNRIYIVCYSFTSWKDQYGEALQDFLNKKSSNVLKILLLEPRSRGFFEKSAFESFNKNHNIKKWITETKETRITHLDELKASIRRIKAWKRKVNNKNIFCSMYHATPLFTGVIIDNVKMLISSYYINPIRRGVDLPAYCIEVNDSNYDLRPLVDLILNWYNVTFAIGLESEYLKKEFYD